nr:unnamed protein product [Callosobruchus chinensis]
MQSREAQFDSLVTRP